MSQKHCNRRTVLRGLVLSGLASWQLGASATSLAQVQERGTLKVGIYNDMPPFHAQGHGIDVDLAQALADSLNVKLTLLPFNADDNMNDDLRNMVWKGHYLGYGPADVLLHVPVDAPLMNGNPQVLIFAPYCRERVAIARNLARIPDLDSLAPLVGQPVAVPGQSLAGWLLIGSESGILRDSLRTQWKDGTEAAKALVRGEVIAAGGLASELESVLQGDPQFAISALPVPRAPRDGWAVGMAVKRDATDLAEALTRSMESLAQSGRMREIFAAGHVNWSMA